MTFLRCPLVPFVFKNIMGYITNIPFMLYVMMLIGETDNFWEQMHRVMLFKMGDNLINMDEHVALKLCCVSHT